MGLGENLDRCRIFHPHQDLIPQPCGPQSVDILTVLSQIMYQDLNNGHILLQSFTDTILDSAKYFSTYQCNLARLPEREKDPSNIPLLNHLLLLIKRYNLCKVRACSTTFFKPSLFCTTFFQLRTFMLFISSKTSSSQRVLGLPIGLLDTGFRLLIFSTLLSLAMHSTWPRQFSLYHF